VLHRDGVPCEQAQGAAGESEEDLAAHRGDSRPREAEEEEEPVNRRLRAEEKDSHPHGAGCRGDEGLVDRAGPGEGDEGLMLKPQE
jgi:hypothetical protein